MIDYKKAIETSFKIKPKKGGEEIPFILNPVQSQYLQMLENDYPTMEGIRDNILKARQQGFSAIIDAIFTVDFLSRENIVGQIISHKEKETKPLIQRVQLYINSWLNEQGLRRSDILKVDTQGYMEHINGSELFIGTAGAKTLGRGGTVQNLHWSEVGFYPNTEIINAETLVTGAEQQVAVGVGKIFRESTGNATGDFFHGECKSSKEGKSIFHFRFFPWFNDPSYRLDPPPNFQLTEEEAAMKRRFKLDDAQVVYHRFKSMEYRSQALFRREYPSVEKDAFLAPGDGYFDADVLATLMDDFKEPTQTGSLAADGGWM